MGEPNPEVIKKGFDISGSIDKSENTFSFSTPHGGYSDQQGLGNQGTEIKVTLQPFQQ